SAPIQAARVGQSRLGSGGGVGGSKVSGEGSGAGVSRGPMRSPEVQVNRGSTVRGGDGRTAGRTTRAPGSRVPGAGGWATFSASGQGAGPSGGRLSWKAATRSFQTAS